MIDLFFSGELKTQIMKYCKKLEAISEEYDVLIFMARKAICFYDALILNNMVKKPNHNVVITTSSRILSYDCEFLKGKKIALLDDIVLKGTTLNETIKFLLEKEIYNFDVYYIASQSLENEKLKQIKSHLKEPILELESSEILILSNSITNYINASACSYNVDYPVFYLDSGNDFYENYILKNNCATVPNANQETKSNMYVQNFNCYNFFEKYDIQGLNVLKTRETEVILKLRIFYRPESNKRSVVVIPIVVLPELSGNDIRSIFESVASTELFLMVKNTDENKELGNMTNLIQYILSYHLFNMIFQGDKQFEFIYSFDNQNYIFPQSYQNDIIKCLKKCTSMPKAYLEKIEIVDDYFALSEVYRNFFDYIGEKHQIDNEHKTKFSFQEIFKYCNTMVDIVSTELLGYISIIFDYAIDSGLIVPEFSKNNGKYIRCYRLSEQYELQEKEFDLIIYMYNEYQNKTQKKAMNSILVEKLLVLFFKEVIMKILKSYNENQDESEKPKNLFGITYARFGPVVSDNALEIGISKESYLTTRLFDNSRSSYKRLYNANRNEKYHNTNEKKNSKIYVKQSTDNWFANLPDIWKRNARLFVNKYDYFEKILDFYKVFDEVSFINTFDQFLTISAIGDSKDNQLLSLAAELKIYYTKINNKQSNEEIVVALDSIMDGIESGIWKYICYTTNEYKRCYKVIANRIEATNNKIQQYNYEIKQYRNYLDKLKGISVSSIDDLKENVNSFLQLYLEVEAVNKNNIQYIIYVENFNRLYKDKDECKRYLNAVTSILKEKVYDRLNEVYLKKDNINYEYVNIDKLDELYTEHNNETNRNEDLQIIVEKLMDESALLIYEIIHKWNYIIDHKKQGDSRYKIGYKEKNFNYLKNAKSILVKKECYRNRLSFAEDTYNDFESTINRLQEIVYEVDSLLYCINQYILRNSSKFIPIHSFYIIRRDDGNEIESDEILSYKHKESPLNCYFGFESSKSHAAFVKSKQSTNAIEKIIDFSGYTLIDYECNRGCSIIIKLGENCYSKYVKRKIDKVLKENFNKKIVITDER